MRLGEKVTYPYLRSPLLKSSVVLPIGTALGGGFVQSSWTANVIEGEGNKVMRASLLFSLLPTPRKKLVSRVKQERSAGVGKVALPPFAQPFPLRHTQKTKRGSSSSSSERVDAPLSLRRPVAASVSSLRPPLARLHVPSRLRAQALCTDPLRHRRRQPIRGSLAPPPPACPAPTSSEHPSLSRRDGPTQGRETLFIGGERNPLSKSGLVGQIFHSFIH